MAHVLIAVSLVRACGAVDPLDAVSDLVAQLKSGGVA